MGDADIANSDHNDDNRDPRPNIRIVPVHEHLEKAGSDDMAVDGSTTPQDFVATPATGETWYITQVAIYLEDPGLMSSTNFGAISALTNGLELIMDVNLTPDRRSRPRQPPRMES